MSYLQKLFVTSVAFNWHPQIRFVFLWCGVSLPHGYGKLPEALGWPRSDEKLSHHLLPLLSQIL